MKLKTILTVVTIISLLFGVYSNIQNSRNKAEKERVTTNLHQKTIQYEDELGRAVTETTRLQVTNKELKKVLKKDSSKMDEYERTIYKIAKELKTSKRLAKNLESSLIAETITNFKLSDRVRDTVFRKMEAKTVHFKDPFGEYSATYIPEVDSMYMSIMQRNELYIDMFKQRPKNNKGKKFIIPLRWFKGWEHVASIKSLNDSTIINDFTVIDVYKK
jgi:hypothetical protein